MNECDVCLMFPHSLAEIEALRASKKFLVVLGDALSPFFEERFVT
jgi:hypothetical protein